MKNLLALAAAALIVFAAVGWYLGWYNVSRTTDPSGHQKINIDVNSPKITKDINKGFNKVKDKVRDALSKDKDTSQPPKTAEQDQSPKPPLPPLPLQITGDTITYPPAPPVQTPGPVVPADYTPRKEPPRID